MLEIKIDVHLHAPELVEAIKGLKATVVEVDAPEKALEEAQEEAPKKRSRSKKKAQEEVATPVEIVPVDPVVEPDAISNVPSVTKDMLARAGSGLVDAGKMTEVINLLRNKYGVASVVQLKPEQYDAMAEDLRALGAEI